MANSDFSPVASIAYAVLSPFLLKIKSTFKLSLKSFGINALAFNSSVFNDPNDRADIIAEFDYVRFKRPLTPELIKEKIVNGNATEQQLATVALLGGVVKNLAGLNNDALVTADYCPWRPSIELAEVQSDLQYRIRDNVMFNLYVLF